MGQAVNPRMTLADYLELPEDGIRYEVLDGELMMSPAPGYRHQKLLANLFWVLERWRRDAGVDGDVLFAPFDVVLSDNDIVQPDLLFLSREQLSNIRDGRLHGVPSLAVEAFNARGARRDRVAKLQVYARWGIPEYWLVDIDARSIAMLALVGGGYETFAQGTAEEPLRSRKLAGLTVIASEVFAGV